jgi:nonsense-mediated mRNA decay protein 3
VILIKKIYPELARAGRKRIFKLERMDLEKEGKDYDEFLDELEQDPDLRANVNMYRNPEVREEVKVEDETFPAVKLEELIGALTLNDS